MSNKINRSTEGSLVYEDCLPLAWEKFETKLDPAKIVLIHNSNEDILKAIYALDEGNVENEDLHSTLAQQLSRMDAKINFLMGMVGQLLAKSLIIPETRPISLDSNGLNWLDNHAPEIDDYIHIELYLKINYPQPIILPAIVNSVENLHENSVQDYKISVSFENLNTYVEEWIEKLIFRHHRRVVALSRR